MTARAVTTPGYTGAYDAHTSPDAVWHDAAWPACPPLYGTVEADVCVIGLGGSGLACAH